MYKGLITLREVIAASNSFLLEGTSINRTPIFNGDGYFYWKTHMRIFIEAIDLDVRNVVQNGPLIPTNLVDKEKS